MKPIYIGVVIAMIGFVTADEPRSDPDEPQHEEQTASTTATRKLAFCILDYGSPHIYGSPPSYWIDGTGRVLTQQFESSDKGMREERYEYALTPKEQSDLLELLEVLRRDDRVLRERYLVPGEFSPQMAFSISPSSDLIIRQKHLNDEWERFSAVSGYLWRLHQQKIKGIKPVFTGQLETGNLWAPEGFVDRKTINNLSYFSSDRYDAMLEENSKSEQDGADQPATDPELKSEGKDKPQPESEVAPR